MTMTNKILSKEIVSYAKIRCRSVFSLILSCRRMIKKASCIEKSESGFQNDYVHGIKEFIPKLTSDLHKGQCGRIGIVGGSLEYTGAPYFAAISALKLGADLVYIICCREAAPVIKSYSPELIVYPFLDDPQALEKISPCLERLHSLVIGPGLGREPGISHIKKFLHRCGELHRTVLLFTGIFKKVEEIVSYCGAALNRWLPLIIDADGLFLITQKPSLVKDYKGPVILTPNIMEYSRLCKKLSIKESDFDELAGMLNSVVLIKGNLDTICNGMKEDALKLGKESKTIICSVPGSVRRCGGQGDILSGCTAVFAAWYIFKRYNGSIDINSDFFMNDKSNIENCDLSIRKDVYKDRYHGFSLACYAACCITRHCSHIGYEKHGRSMTASDMICFIYPSFVHFFGECVVEG